MYITSGTCLLYFPFLMDLLIEKNTKMKQPQKYSFFLNTLVCVIFIQVYYNVNMQNEIAIFNIT